MEKMSRRTFGKSTILVLDDYWTVRDARLDLKRESVRSEDREDTLVM